MHLALGNISTVGAGLQPPCTESRSGSRFMNVASAAPGAKQASSVVVQEICRARMTLGIGNIMCGRNVEKGMSTLKSQIIFFSSRLK